MADIKTAFGTASTFTCTLASLANGSSRQSTIIDNSSNKFLDALVLLKIKTGASGVSSTGYVEIYALGTVDEGTTYTDNAGASDAALTVNNARLIGTISATANATTYYGGPFSVAQAFGGVLPKKWGIAVKNSTGAALDATEGNHAKQYQEIFATVV